MNRERGFTLLELMTAIGIAAILVSVAVPGLRTLTMNTKQRSGVNELLSAMHLARNSAITTNSRVTLCPSADGASCAAVSWSEGWIVFTDLNSDQIVDADETVMRAGSKNEGLQITSSQFGSFLMYRPNGRVMSASANTNFGQFSVCDERGADHAKVVAIELSGRPRVQHGTANGIAPSCNSI